MTFSNGYSKMLNNFDITDVEKDFSDAVRALSVTANVWNNRPRATDEDVSDFAVVRVVGGISDIAAYGSCRVLVTLFARDVKEMKNAKKLSLMQKKLASIPLDLQHILISQYPRVIGDTADDFGFHSRTLNFKVFIKSV